MGTISKMINLEEQAMLKTSSCRWINQSSRLRGIFNELTNRTHIDLSQKTTCYPYGRVRLPTGLHKLCYPTIWDRSTWSKLGAYGEHGDIFLFSNFDRCALILRELNQLFIACLFKGSQEQSFFLQTLLYTAFLVTVLKMSTYALVSTWFSVSSGWEHVKRKMHPWLPKRMNFWKDQNGLWPPPPSFSENYIGIFFQKETCWKTSSKVQHLQYKLLDWKWPPPLLELFQHSYWYPTPDPSLRP